MAEEKDPLVAPPLEIEIRDKKIKMTYGLEMDIRRMLPDPNTILELALTDPFTQDYVVRRCLTDLNEIVTDETKLVPQDQVDLSGEEIEKLLLWALDHAMYFFMKRTQALGALGDRYRKVLQSPSNDGSKDSASKTPSVGDSESSKATSTPSTGDTPDENSNSASSSSSES